MKILLDTHILLWHGLGILPPSAQTYIRDESNVLLFSPASIWEVVIKLGLNRPDFNVDPYILSNGLLADGFDELPITTRHALSISTLPIIHKDPFDRILLAQAITEGILLLTFDNELAKYGAPVIFVQK
jgi:PIN domain nuclease of toxin-antitoxin system